MNLLTPCKVADLLGVHVQTVYRNNSLPKVRLGRGIRYREQDIQHRFKQATAED